MWTVLLYRSHLCRVCADIMEIYESRGVVVLRFAIQFLRAPPAS